MPVVYIDQFVLVNLVLNYILLSLTKRILHANASNPRIFLGSVIGTVYAVFMLFPQSAFLFTLAGKLLFSLVLVAITYQVQGVKRYLRTMAVFYLVFFVFGGCMFAVLNFLQQNLQGALSLRVLISCTVISYFLLSLGSAYYKRRTALQHHLVQLTITLEGKRVEVQALVDTGNSLCDPLSANPVIVADGRKLAPLLPEDIPDCATSDEWLTALSVSSLQHRLRVIPFFSVGEPGSFLVGLRVDEVLIEGSATQAVVAICPHPVSSDENYFALVHPQLMQT